MTFHDVVPFAAHGDKDHIKRALFHRLRIVKRFMGDYRGRKILDIGEPNRFAQYMGIGEHTLDTDFNKEILAPGKDYDIVTCFEVVEHVMNPLLMMQRIYELLKPGGVCYLSTPIYRFFFVAPNHFTEYKPAKIKKLFQYVGFEVLRYKKFSYFDWYFIFYGFRPIFRVLSQRHQLWEIRKPC